MMSDKTKQELWDDQELIERAEQAMKEINEMVEPDFGEPCDHPGCLSHHSHPCEGCGRIGGKPATSLYRPPRCD